MSNVRPPPTAFYGARPFRCVEHEGILRRFWPTKEGSIGARLIARKEWTGLGQTTLDAKVG